MNAPILNSLFDHQSDALQRLRQSVGSGHKRPLVSIPTAGGKTIIGCHIVHGSLRKGNRIGFTVPKLSIIDQTFERFIENGIDPSEIDVMQGNHSWHRPHAPVKIISAQTLGRRERPLVDVVLVDEAHIAFKSIRDWMQDEPEKVFIGLSATPWRKGMREEYDDLIQPTSIRELIKIGRLCNFRAFAPSKPDLDKIKTVAGDYHQGELGQVMRKSQLVADVVQTWLEKAERRPTLCYAVDLPHASQLHDQFSGMGVRSAYVDGDTEREERNSLVKMLEDGRLEVIVSVGTMTTGVDIPCVSCISDARPTKSEMLYVQMIGRGLRTHPGKDHLLILDHSFTTLKLGTVDSIGHDELLSGKRCEDRGVERPEKKMPSPRECPSCQVLIPALDRECPGCGFVPKMPSRVCVEDGELEEVGMTAAQRKANRHWETDDKARFHGELKLYCHQKGYKEGWAAAKYRSKFGVWPNMPEIRHAQRARSVSDATLAWIRSQNIRWARRKEA